MVSILPLNLACQVATFLSSLALARVLGATSQTDAYYLALSIPVLAYGVLLTTLRSGAVPALAEARRTTGTEGLSDRGSELFSGVIAVSTLVVALAIGLVELLLPLFTHGQLLSETRSAVLELSPYALLGAAMGVLSAVLAACRVYLIPIAVLLLEPLIKAVLTISFGAQIGIQALIAGNLLGAGSAVVVLWLVLRRNAVTIHIRLPRVTPFLRSIARLSAPLMAGSSILLFNPVIDRSMAGGIGPGSITALELGLRLLAPIGLMTSFLSAPLVSEWTARRAVEGERSVHASATRAVGAAATFLTPIVVLGVLLRKELVLFLFKGGAYPAEAVAKTASVFGMIVLSVPVSFLITLLGALFLVQRNAVFLLQNACANVVLNVALNFAFRPLFGVAGIALSTTLTLTILMGRLVLTARRRWGLFAGRDVIPILGRTATSAAVTVPAGILFLRAIPGADTHGSALASIAIVSAVVVLLHCIILLVGRDPLARGVVSRLLLARRFAAQPPTSR